ncbi:fibrinogen-like protein 1 [Drosophila rhopaloa]|uniref:Fibrinogen C-terminal domain-containing protein n=1 Tax=Drosophila rhopaloa TaxID=1041015 RepID=A0ABM5GVT2_DRORH|nr:fibrinogen-like protein 1 [Drosophila rhopaloa]
MKSECLVIVLMFFLFEEHPFTDANSIKDLQQDPSNQFIKSECNEYCFLIFKPVLDHFVQLKVASDTNQELKSQVNTMKETILHLQSQLAMKEEFINAKNEQAKAHDEHLKNRDEQILDLRNHIKSIETSLTEKSKLLLECQKADDNLPDSCPSGSPNGIYQIKLRGLEAFKVPCVSSPSGWTVIQRRLDGSENFDRNWDDYKRGFGNISGEFFIGLEKLHRMTEARPHELYIKLGMVNGSTSYAQYDDFKVGHEDEFYQLKNLGKYSGNAGDSLTVHKIQKFSTFDRDNDEYNGNCAGNENGGWWFYSCSISSLNAKYYKDGKYVDGGTSNSINWGTWHNYDWNISLTFVEMMIRPTSL